jgi:microcompartment protein CcmL/EutN
MLEFTSISAGIESADAMVKAADVSALFFRTICPGKFLAAVHGDVAAVEASVLAGRQVMPSCIADGFVIPNIHKDVIAALGGCAPLVERAALGVIETFSVSSAILSADAAAKAADVRIMEVRTALGLGGKGYVLLTGNVGAAKTAVAAGSESARSSGLLVGTALLPRPAGALFNQLL